MEEEVSDPEDYIPRVDWTDENRHDGGDWDDGYRDRRDGKDWTDESRRALSPCLQVQP